MIDKTLCTKRIVSISKQYKRDWNLEQQQQDR